eukprot:2274298-Prymnesium_polylepis.1
MSTQSEFSSIPSDLEGRKPVKWLANRVFSVCIAAWTMCSILYIEDFMRVLRPMVEGMLGLVLNEETRPIQMAIGGSTNPEIVACEDLPLTVICSGIVVALISTIIFATCSPQSEHERMLAIVRWDPMLRTCPRVRPVVERIQVMFERCSIVFLSGLTFVYLYDKLRGLPPAGFGL